MNLKDIQTMWKTDCPIDSIELDLSSLEQPKLHAKYCEILSDKKLEVIRYERQMKELDKDGSLPNKVQNNLFVGSSTELQRLLKDHAQK